MYLSICFTYNQINDIVNEMFPQINGYNTYYGSMNYFKPNINFKDIKELFD